MNRVGLLRDALLLRKRWQECSRCFVDLTDFNGG
jgi:hypothetical protein